jgi:hypothetical protein
MGVPTLCKNRILRRENNGRRKCVSNFGLINWFGQRLPVLASRYNNKPGVFLYHIYFMLCDAHDMQSTI